MVLTIHHLHFSQSERIPWLCEELGVPYTLTLHTRAPIFSPPSLLALAPLSQAPVIQDGDLTLAESAACVEYIIHKYGNGRLALPPNHKDYADFLYWFHFANGTFQPQLLLLLTLSMSGADMSGPRAKRALDRFDQMLRLLNTQLQGNEWLAGDEFSAADVMIVSTLTTMRSFQPYDLSEYEALLGYLKRVTERVGYQRARAKADPDLELMIDGEPPTSFIERLKSEGKL